MLVGRTPFTPLPVGAASRTFHPMDLDFGIRLGIASELEKGGHLLGRWLGSHYHRKALCKRCRRYVELHRVRPNALPSAGAKRFEHPLDPELVFEATGTLLRAPQCEA
jgi:hypothetical protein